MATRRNYTVVYMNDQSAEPEVFFVSTTRMVHDVITSESFDEADDRYDIHGNRIPMTYIKFLHSIGISCLEANESVTFVEIPDVKDIKKL